jgi:hypothetical protein
MDCQATSTDSDRSSRSGMKWSKNHSLGPSPVLQPPLLLCREHILPLLLRGRHSDMGPIRSGDVVLISPCQEILQCLEVCGPGRIGDGVSVPARPLLDRENELVGCPLVEVLHPPDAALSTEGRQDGHKGVVVVASDVVGGQALGDAQIAFELLDGLRNRQLRVAFLACPFLDRARQSISPFIV